METCSISQIRWIYCDNGSHGRLQNLRFSQSSPTRQPVMHAGDCVLVKINSPGFPDKHSAMLPYDAKSPTSIVSSNMPALSADA